MKKHVLAIDVSPLPRDHRGMGFFVREFLNHLPGVDHPFTIHLVIPETTPPEFPWPYPVLKPGELDSTEIVWFPFNHPNFKGGGKYAITLHDLAPFVFPGGESRLRKLFKEGIKEVSRVFADSRFIAGQIQEILNVPKSKIAVIPPGFDPKWDALRIRPEWPKEDAFVPPKPYLLSIGPAEKRKNIDTLIAAFRILKSEKIPHKLVVLGELPPWRHALGPFSFESANPLPGLARKMGLENEVLFPGVVSRAGLRHLYEGASLVVVPSLYEGFGFPVLEAYSCQTPVACSQAASLPEVAGGGAFYFDPRNPENMASVIRNALSDPNERTRRKESAQIRLSQFDWRTCIGKYFEAFQALEEGKAPLSA